MSSRIPRIGLSACLMHPDFERDLFKGKRLLYAEESMVHWVLESGCMPVLLPTWQAAHRFGAEEIVKHVDGLLLQGGADVAPESYGSTARRPAWAGDIHRDAYETELIVAALRQDRPILGVCRGLQILNVAFGGTLFQDVSEEVPGSLVHRNPVLYDQNRHAIRLEEGSGLQALYPGSREVTVNSVHHQAVRDAAQGFQIEATSTADGVIEAMRLVDPRAAERLTRQQTNVLPYVVGVQWHPEFQSPEDHDLLDRGPLLDSFIAAVQKRMGIESA
ncbi:MAG: gamma-glutamyl-gamma-aminobutyrate hydrolase family protein [Spirochaetales bacterium]|nr:gamma-glutamyl-gamma-aminobutyrate hydrolase family protein [Leptospiraceae bacterium]MCP5482990.1 gamma-glutamyl-gamma-aminobutyrate hydrolase family protein [Spirochaetales bacterium]MCP5484831.1 gamma-glutamyl-gamma-aminobutyrate hydrolase family protein [Spirochaetales bacterium]